MTFLQIGIPDGYPEPRRFSREKIVHTPIGTIFSLANQTDVFKEEPHWRYTYTAPSSDQKLPQESGGTAPACTANPLLTSYITYRGAAELLNYGA